MVWSRKIAFGIEEGDGVPRAAERADLAHRVGARQVGEHDARLVARLEVGRRRRRRLHVGHQVGREVAQAAQDLLLVLVRDAVGRAEGAADGVGARPPKISEMMPAASPSERVPNWIGLRPRAIAASACSAPSLGRYDFTCAASARTSASTRESST